MTKYAEFINAMHVSNQNFIRLAFFALGILLGWLSLRLLPVSWRPAAAGIYLGVWLLIYIFIPVYFGG